MTDENQIGVGRFGGRFGFRLYAGAVGSPGAYTVSVKQGGNTYKGTVLKR